MDSTLSGTCRGVAFALIYTTFFLDNVLLTVLVPIIPDWVRGESLALWARRDAPLAAALNDTVHRITSAKGEGGAGGWQAAVGLVLGAKAGAQLLVARSAGVVVSRIGPARVLRAATALLALAAVVFAACGAGRAGGAAACCGLGRAAHGVAAALAGVAGLALAAAARAPMGALLGAVALGVLVGYPFGGVADALHMRSAPFLLIAAALLLNLALQWKFLDRNEFNKVLEVDVDDEVDEGGVAGVWVARRAERAAAGAVLLTTSVMAALEPCLPLWIDEKFHAKRWQLGVVFIPDSAGYLVAATLVGSLARRVGAERVALAGQLAVGLAALALPHASSVSGLAGPHVVLGLGLGAADAALVPALLARAPTRVPQLAAMLQAASSAAYALGPVLGGAVSWCVGFESALRALAVLNLLYLAVLYRALAADPLSKQVCPKKYPPNSEM